MGCEIVGWIHLPLLGNFLISRLTIRFWRGLCPMELLPLQVFTSLYYYLWIDYPSSHYSLLFSLNKYGFFFRLTTTLKENTPLVKQEVTAHKRSISQFSLYLINHHAMKAYWESARIAPCILNLGTIPLYRLIKRPCCPLDRRLVGPQSVSGRDGEENKAHHCTCQELNPCSLVTILVEV